MEKYGIVLAGGLATRLFPLTSSVNKHLLPIYSKPMIYYPISTLMISGIKKIIIVVDPGHIDSFKKLLGDGSDFGIEIKFCFQENPDGLASAIYSAKDIAKNSKLEVILGDNVFFGKGLEDLFSSIKSETDNVLFTQKVNNPNSYGVLKRNTDSSPKVIIEKPKKFISNEAVLGLYFYDSDVFNFIEEIKPSKRNELEITDLNNLYLDQKKVKVLNIGRGITWYDAGTINDLFSVSSFIHSIEVQQKTLIGSIEEIALRKNYISEKRFMERAKIFSGSDYGKKLSEIIDN